MSDPYVPQADAAEQERAVVDDPVLRPATAPSSAEADEFDALEQAAEVPADDEGRDRF
ncbi:MAG TPA: hypothetical protein VFP61_11000 [Acidimicrobiales bacterium]|nr:hypothetical protein [Acidimicrobiales bacterium]